MPKIKKLQWGGISSPVFTPTYNSGTSLYGQLTNPDFNQIGNSFSSSILQGGQLDTLGQKIKYDNSTKTSLDNIQKMSSGEGVVQNPTETKGPSKVGKFLSSFGSGLSTLTSAIPTADKVHNDNDQLMADVRGTANNVLMSGAFGPWGVAAGAANMAIDKLGGFTDASQGLGKGTDTANMFASFLVPGAGFFTKKTLNYKMSDTLKQNSSGYGGTFNKASTAEKNAGAKLLFGKGKANFLIADAKMQDTKVNDIIEKNNLALAASNNPLISMRIEGNQRGGYQQNTTQAGKNGMKLDRDFAKNVVKLSKGNKNKTRPIGELIQYAKQQNPRFIQRLSEPPRGIKFVDDNGNEAEGSHYLESAGEYVIPRIQEVDGNLKFFNHQDAVNRAIETGNYLKMSPEEAIIFAKEYKQGWPEFFKKFKNGGTVNVIPDGALHKNKHHLENIDERFEDVTTKGIPVITEGKGGDITQHAEVEREEIIFNLEVTKQLEKLMEDGSDEAAIEAGKLLVHEILENTVDNTGLLNKID